MLKQLYQKISLCINEAWYKKGPSSCLYLLRPFSKLFERIVNKRYQKAKAHLRPGRQRAPIIVVGNITVGGSGKTPFIMALAKLLQHHNYKPGIVMRGYGGHAPFYPYFVDLTSTVKETGDEAFLLYKELNCPIVIDPDRTNAVKHLLEFYTKEVNIVLSDDGLQHYNLARDYEIVIIDVTRGIGNGWCLPAGPLREPVSRLQDVDLVIAQGESPDWPATMTLKPLCFVEVDLPHTQLPLDFKFSTPVHAVAGIANPERFFASLRELGLQIIPHAFPDHHQFYAAELDYNDKYPIIMTAKDAVKCQLFAQPGWYYLQVTPELNEVAIEALQRLLKV